MPEWVMPVLFIVGRIVDRLADRWRTPPWQLPSQWTLVVLLCVLTAALLLPAQPQWVRRTIQLALVVAVAAAAMGAGAFDMIIR